MLKFIASFGLGLVLLSVPALAADTNTQTDLSPGKPAGVHQANGFRPNYPVIFIAVTLVVVVGGIYLAAHNLNRNTSTSSASP